MGGVGDACKRNLQPPYPATSDSRSTSVGTLSIRRFLRPVSYQNLPEAVLPEPLRSATLPARIDGVRRM